MKPRIVFLAAILLASPAAVRAQAPKILEFRTHTVNGKTYFHVRMERPKDMKANLLRDAQGRFMGLSDFAGLDSAVRPRLVPQDAAARLVYGSDRGDGRHGATMNQLCPAASQQVIPPTSPAGRRASNRAIAASEAWPQSLATLFHRSETPGRHRANNSVDHRRFGWAAHLQRSSTTVASNP